MTASAIPPARAARRLCWENLIICLLLLLSACRQAPPVVDEVTQRLSEAGGSVTLPGSVSATFSEGFLVSSTDVTVSMTDTPEPYPKDVAASYPAGSAEAMTKGVTVSFPSRALGNTGELSIRVPTVVPRLEGEERLLSEVHLFLADGQHLFFFEPYARVDSVGEPTEGSDTVTLSAAQLRPVDAANQDLVRVNVRPVRLSNRQLSPQALPGGFVLEDVVSGLEQGVAFEFADDGRIFIAEKAGVVRVVENGVLRKAPFIDLRRQVNAFQARGLLGLELHPQFPRQPYVYLLFTHDPPEVYSRTGMAGPDNAGARVSRLVRVTADAAQNYNVAVPGSERILLGKNSIFATIGNPAERNGAVPSCGPVGNYVNDCIPADEVSHTIGALRFAPDGSLFVSSGDGADFTRVRDYALRAGDLDSLAGKLLRINPETGEGYANNPFYDGNPNSNRSKVYNSGMRNPFRFTLHPQTGAPYIGDVGWGTWEEVNTGRGRNFGWPCFEGGSGDSLQQGGYRALNGCRTLYRDGGVTSALYAYVHGSGGSSVQVGDFYFGEGYPAAYKGLLFVNDYNQGLIRTLELSSSGALVAAKNFSTEPGVVQMRAGPRGDLYLINIYDGKLKRLRYNAPAGVTLKAAASGTPLEGAAPLTVAFSSEGSSGSGISYSWDFGNGETSSEPNSSVTFSNPGSYRVSLQVSDAGGDVSLSSLTVRVGNALPTATIVSPAEGTRYTVGGTVSFSGGGSDPDDGELSGEALSWTLNTHHNDHVHSDGLPTTTGNTGSFVPDNHGDNIWLELCLTARDVHGETATDCTALRPQTAAYTLQTIPAGLTLPWEGVTRRTPFTVQTIVGGTQQLIAPAQRGYTFVAWSDGGGAVHDVEIGDVPTTLTATYTASAHPPTGTPNFSFSAVCRDHYLIESNVGRAVRLGWQVVGTRVRGSVRLGAMSSRELVIRAGDRNVRFFINGRRYYALRPSLVACP